MSRPFSLTQIIILFDSRLFSVTHFLILSVVYGAVECIRCSLVAHRMYDVDVWPNKIYVLNNLSC